MSIFTIDIACLVDVTYRQFIYFLFFIIMANSEKLADYHEESNGAAVVSEVVFMEATRSDISVEGCVQHLKSSGLNFVRRFKEGRNFLPFAVECYNGYGLGTTHIISRETKYKLKNLKPGQLRFNNETLLNNKKKSGEEIELKLVFILMDPYEGALLTFDIVE